MKNLSIYIKESLSKKSILIAHIIYLLAMLTLVVFSIISLEPRSIALTIGFLFLVPLILVVEYLLKMRIGLILLILLYLLAIGAMLGSSFNFYTYIPILDTVLHGMSGIIFASLGSALAIKLFKENKSMFGVILFGAFFSLSIALLWEVFEYTCTSIFGFDMMEDSLIFNINSYLLSGSHIETVKINDITQTIIHYGDGKTYTINGYLDIGLLDTLEDMIVCLIGTSVFMVFALIADKINKNINKLLIPEVY